MRAVLLALALSVACPGCIDAFVQGPLLLGRAKGLSHASGRLSASTPRHLAVGRGRAGGARCTAVEPGQATSVGVDVAPPLKQTPPFKISVMVEPTPFTHISGYSNRYKEMLDYLAVAGDNVSVMCPDDTEDPPAEYKGFPITYTPGFRFSLYNHICLSCDHTFTGMKMLKKERPDVLHISTPGFIVLVATIYAKLMRIPVVMSYHTHLPVYAERYMGFMPFIVPISWLVIRFIHNYADLSLVTSPQMKEDFEANGVKRVEVWRKGINTEHFNPKWRSQEMRERLSGGNPHDMILVYIGRLGKEKRIQDLRPVLDANPKLRLALVGQGPFRTELEEIFKGTNTIFTGMLKGQPLWEAFASADVMCMPSDSETLGFVVLESLASGVPVVGANAGGLKDLIQEGSNGYLVEPGDSAAIGDRVRKLQEDKELRERLGKNGRAFAELWSWESATSVLRNVQYPKAKENFQSWRSSTVGPIRGLQLLFLALVGVTSTSIVGFGCILDSIWGAMSGRQIAEVEK